MVLDTAVASGRWRAAPLKNSLYSNSITVQRVPLHGGLVLAESRPRKQRQAEVDGCRIESVQSLVQVHTDRVVGLSRPCHAHQELREVRLDPPVARLVRSGQCPARYPAAESPGVEFAVHRTQARRAVAEAFPIAQLGQCHRKKLIPAGETFPIGIAARARYRLVKLFARQVLDQWGENRTAKVHPPLCRLGMLRSGGHLRPRDCNRAIDPQQATTSPAMVFT